MKRWRALAKLSAIERAFLKRIGLSSQALEVCCLPGQSSISVLQESDGRFHWAHLAVDGECRDEGFEDTLETARHAASEAMALWAHRCAALGKHKCPGFCHPGAKP